MTTSKSASMHKDVAIQRAYYADTAENYDARHLAESGEHVFALHFMMSAMEHFGFRSILDIGSGTGRALTTLREKMPHVSATGVEPSQELRKIGYAKGLSDTQLIDGDGMNLTFANGSFDVVCEFGVLHHVPEPNKVVAEMLRVARKAIFISDSNNFGQGSKVSRFAKQAVHAAGLWPLANLVKTRGKQYSISEGDGLYYSYSVFNNYKQIAARCESVHVLNTTNGGVNPYRSASHVALLGILR